MSFSLVGRARATFRCGVKVSSGGFSLAVEQLEHTGSVVVAHGLSFPHQGLNPCPLHCQAGS